MLDYMYYLLILFSAWLKDTNECLVNNGRCDPDASCINTPGSHLCVCDDGYTGSGLECYGRQASLPMNMFYVSMKLLVLNYFTP